VFHDWFYRPCEVCTIAWEIMCNKTWVMEHLELDWEYLKEVCDERTWIAQLGMFCLGVLRGEEITKIELGGARKHFSGGGT
jgi:hypothetical protein